MSFVVYNRLSEAELREAAKKTALQLEDWFKNNPKRRICKAELWYGSSHKIKRKNVAEQINAIVEEILKEKS